MAPATTRDQWAAEVANASGGNNAGISWATPSVKARSVAACPEGNEDVIGPIRPLPEPGSRLRPTRGLMRRLATIAVPP